MIKLKNILLNEDEVDDAFGDIVLGSDYRIAGIQGASEKEPDTEYEKELKEILARWLMGSLDSDADKLYAMGGLLKKASKKFTILRPMTPNGTELYRGIRNLNPNLAKKLLVTDLNSYEEVSVVPAGGWSTKFYKYELPVKYTPNRKVQSWTSEFRVAAKSVFGGEALLVTEQTDEFLFNQELMAVLFGSNLPSSEYEVLHFGKTFSKPIYILLREDYFDELRGKKYLPSILKKEPPKTKQEVENVLKMLIGRSASYTVNDDLSVSFPEGVALSPKSLPVDKLEVLPVKFHRARSFRATSLGLKTLKGSPRMVDVDFDCSRNALKNLEGSPDKVEMNFYCDDNQLVTLRGCTQSIGWSFSCTGNQLKNLEGGPVETENDYDCSNNKLVSLKGAPKKVDGRFICSNNRLVSLKDAPRQVGGRFICKNNPDLSQSEKDWAERNISAGSFIWE